MGTAKGEIRLFDQKIFGEGRKSKADTIEDRKPRAKTSLPGFGGMCSFAVTSTAPASVLLRLLLRAVLGYRPN